MSKPARPELRFDTLDAMLADAERLALGYERAGQWELGTILDHLTKSLSTPFAPGQKNLPWPVAATLRFFMRAMVRRGRYPAIKFPAPSMLKPSPMETAPALAAFREVVERVKGLPDGVIECPPAGPMRSADFVAVQLLHAAHHLAFLRPTGPRNWSIDDGRHDATR
jgi:hypothetical protein